jgi:hypothetical protein
LSSSNNIVTVAVNVKRVAGLAIGETNAPKNRVFYAVLAVVFPKEPLVAEQTISRSIHHIAAKTVNFLYRPQAPTLNPNPMKYLKTILFWAIGITFITIGILKYLHLDAMSEPIFNRAHFPRWFFYAVASVEFVAGILLLLTATTIKKIGSLLVAFVMLGALGTRILLNQHFRHLIVPGLVF